MTASDRLTVAGSPKRVSLYYGHYKRRTLSQDMPGSPFLIALPLRLWLNAACVP